MAGKYGRGTNGTGWGNGTDRREVHPPGLYRTARTGKASHCTTAILQGGGSGIQEPGRHGWLPQQQAAPARLRGFGQRRWGNPQGARHRGPPWEAGPDPTERPFSQKGVSIHTANRPRGAPPLEGHDVQGWDCTAPQALTHANHFCTLGEVHNRPARPPRAASRPFTILGVRQE